MTRNPSGRRRGIAAVEMAFIAPVLLALLVGLWEVGRYIQVQNLLDSTAREGGRLAASSGYFASNNHLDPSQAGTTLTLNSPSTNADYEVQQKVLVYLQALGIPTTGASITVANSTKGWSYTYNASGTGTGSGYDPAAAADQMDQLVVTVSVPYANVRWSVLGWFISGGTQMNAQVNWASMRDYPLAVSTTIPSKPLQSTDPLP